MINGDNEGLMVQENVRIPHNETRKTFLHYRYILGETPVGGGTEAMGGAGRE